MKHLIEWKIAGEWTQFAIAQCDRINAILIVWGQMAVTSEDDTLANWHCWRITEIITE